MRKKSYVLLFVLIIFSLCVRGAAQEDRAAKILYFEAGAQEPEEVFMYSKEGFFAESELPRDNFSPNFLIPKGVSSITFFPKSNAVPKELEGAPQVSFSADWKKILFLVFKDSKNKIMPIRVRAINASADIFGPGSIYAINFSRMTVAGEVGDKKLLLKPQKTEIIKNPISKTGFYPTVLQLKGPEMKKPRDFVKQMWAHHQKHRRMLFIMPRKPPHFATYKFTVIKDL